MAFNFQSFIERQVATSPSGKMYDYYWIKRYLDKTLERAKKEKIARLEAAEERRRVER